MPHSGDRKSQVLHWDDVFAKFAAKADAAPIETIDRDLRAMGYDLDKVKAGVGAIDQAHAARQPATPQGHAQLDTAAIRLHEHSPIPAPAASQQIGADPGAPPRTFRGWHLRSAMAGALGALFVGLIGLADTQTIVGALSRPSMATIDEQSAQLMAERRYAEVEPLYRLALAMEENTSGPGHPKVAVRLNNLAHLLKAASRWEEAEPLMLRALEIDWRHFGSDPVAVARDLNNVAQLLEASDRQEAAEEQYRFALTIFEQFLGSDHPNVATVLSNLAHVLQATGRLGEAEALVMRALAIDTKHFGPDHDIVARDRANLELLRGPKAVCGDKSLFGVGNASFSAKATASAPDPANPGQLLQLTKWQVKSKATKACAL